MEPNAVPDGTAPDRTVRLLGRARAASGDSGFLRFDRWMDLALYADDVGYYNRPRSPLGAGGDFYTAPAVHPLFAATFAARVEEVRHRVGRDRPFTLVELGPGDGTLLSGMVSALGPAWGEGPELRVVLVERSTPLRATAMARARSAAQPFGTQVHAVDSVAAIGPFEGAVVANELLDAQPVRRLRWSGSEWTELGVRIDAHGVHPAEAPPDEIRGGPTLPPAPQAGTVFEFSPRGEGLIREVADHLVDGVWLLDDYGMEEAELLRAHPEGTLATVRGHRSGEDPTATPGRADLSTFVNWTRVRSVASAAGLEVIADRSQAEALGAWGFPRLFDAAIAQAGSAENEVRLRLAVKNLLFGFERFRILELTPARVAAWYRPST